MIIPWKEEYSVKVKEIDDQHQYFIKILSDIYTSITEKKKEREILDLFKELSNYANLHFKTEEKYFDQFNYELADEHKEEHRKLKNEIKKFNKRYQKDSKKTFEITTELIDFLENWLVDHLANQDQKYVKCFSEHGLN